MWLTAVEALPLATPFGGVAGTEEEFALTLEARQIDPESAVFGLGLADEDITLVVKVNELSVYTYLFLYRASLYVSSCSEFAPFTLLLLIKTVRAEVKHIIVR